MGDLFRDKEHLVRAAGLFAGGLLLFLVLRGIFIPAGFGEYGHFRAGALEDNQSTPQNYAGRLACEECHDDVAAERTGSGHEAVACESCHGPLAAHANDPSSLVPEAPEATPLCLNCHRVNVARPSWFPQVEPVDHAEGESCNTCHLPHHPEVE